MFISSYEDVCRELWWWRTCSRLTWWWETSIWLGSNLGLRSCPEAPGNASVAAETEAWSIADSKCAIELLRRLDFCYKNNTMSHDITCSFCGTRPQAAKMEIWPYRKQSFRCGTVVAAGIQWWCCEQRVRGWAAGWLPRLRGLPGWGPGQLLWRWLWWGSWRTRSNGWIEPLQNTPKI